MCGFAGIACPDPVASWDLSGALAKMVESLQHRGPDDHGSWSDSHAGVFLGFRRLSILDLSEAGHQAMVSASGRHVIVFNGEIYNHESIRARLLEAGHRFRGHSDTEVLVAAFERWGVHETLPVLRGMFAISLWDSAERKLWLIRDRLGIKPLYFLETPHGVAFSSEARAFHDCPLFGGGANSSAARGFLRRLYVSGTDSILRGVKRLAPGHLVCFEVGARGVRRAAHEAYWDLTEVARRGAASTLTDPTEVVEAFAEVFREAVRLRLYADVPIGAFLSGGIDSTAVVGMMQELSSEPVRTFTVGFEDSSFDESDVALEVAAVIGTRHTPVRVPPSTLLQLVSDLPAISDEPMANPSIIPTIVVSQVARRDVTVALSGDGGDECFGGYNRYLQGERLIRLRRRVPAGVRPALAGSLSGLVQAGLTKIVTGAFRGQQSLEERALKVSRLVGAPSEAEAYETLLDVGWLQAEADRSPTRARGALAGKHPSALLSRMMLHDQLEYLPDDLLTKVDRATMWESLEGRVPMLDHEVVTFSWRVDPSLKIRNGTTKWPIRQVAARYVPSSVLDRPKMGFTVPIAGWLRGDLKQWGADLLSDAGRTTPSLLDARALQRAWSSLQGGRDDLALGLWAVLVLHQWAAQWKVSLES